MAWNGLQVTASDRDGARIGLLKQTVERVAPGVQIVARDAVAALPSQDFVWIDAPCTGTGIIRRHPDVRWLRREQDLGELLKTQQEVLRTGWEKVRPGGYLAYSVCSVLKEEGPEAVAWLREQGTLVREWFLHPQNEPFGDGFWAALFKKHDA
jgi:16S rRNA (cytosine967-C5)-methyltransferase